MSWLNKIMSWLKGVFRFREQSEGETIKPFLEHLEELRWTVIRMIAAQSTTTIVAFCYRADLMRLLRIPLSGLHPMPRLITSGIGDSLIISMELALFTGLAVAIPFHIYSAASFVLPALTRKERSVLLPGIAAGFLFFLGGVCCAYKLALPGTLAFFWNDAETLILDPLWTWRGYFSFSSWFCFGFGAMCEVPVVVILLARLGFVSFRMLRRTRPYAYTAILLLTAILTPTPDPMMFLMMAIPVVLMYEACIWVVWILDGRKPSAELLAALWLVGAWRRKQWAKIDV